MWRRREPMIAEAEEFHLDIDGAAIRVRLRRDRRAQRFTLRLPPNGGDPVVTLPTDGSAKAARRFVEKERGWLAARLKRRPEAVPFADGAVVPLRGEPHLIVHDGPRRGTVRRDAGGELPELRVAGAAEHLPRRLTDWMKHEARRDLGNAVADHTAALDLAMAPVHVRDTSSRWGSCSSRGTLSFSWRLVLAPPHILHYVAAHEVAHLKEMNHSQRFWRIVHELCPETEAARSWLRHYGPQLHMVGAKQR